MTEQSKDSWEEELEDILSIVTTELGYDSPLVTVKTINLTKKLIRKAVDTARAEGRAEVAEKNLKRFTELFDQYHANKKIAPPPLLTMVKELQSELSLQPKSPQLTKEDE